jgi:hypothetical protein
MNEIQVWSIDGLMLTAEIGNIQRKTFLVPLFPPQRLVDNYLIHDT